MARNRTLTIHHAPTQKMNAQYVVKVSGKIVGRYRTMRECTLFAEGFTGLMLDHKHPVNRIVF